MKTKVWVVAVLVVAFSTSFVPAAQAYVDPGSGSFVFQALIGGLLAVGVVLKMYWKRLVGLVSRRGRDAGPQES
jgi:hypothetical protein